MAIVHPLRSRNRAALVSGVSFVAFMTALLAPKTGTGSQLHIFLLVMGLAATLASAIWLAMTWNDARRYARLCAGKGVIARWRVDPARWEWFRQHSALWDKQEGILANNARLDQPVGKDGIEIVVTGESILIGDDFHTLEKNASITVWADWIECDQPITRPHGLPWHLILRFPLAPGHEQLAAEVQEAYQRAYVSAVSSPRTKLYVALGIFVGLPLITALIAGVAYLTGWIQ